MNELAYLADAYRADYRAAPDLLELSQRLSAVPCGPLYARHVSPDRELAALLRIGGKETLGLNGTAQEWSTGRSLAEGGERRCAVAVLDQGRRTHRHRHVTEHRYRLGHCRPRVAEAGTASIITSSRATGTTRTVP